MIAPVSNLMWRVQRFLYCDPVRPFELFSGLNFLAWSRLFYSQPELILRDSYASFQGFGAGAWATIMLVTGLCQLVSTLGQFPHASNLRFLSMSVAAGVWFMIALNFIVSGVSTTAEANYLLLALICMASGAWLGWTSPRS